MNDVYHYRKFEFLFLINEFKYKYVTYSIVVCFLPKTRCKNIITMHRKQMIHDCVFYIRFWSYTVSLKMIWNLVLYTAQNLLQSSALKMLK